MPDLRRSNQGPYGVCHSAPERGYDALNPRHTLEVGPGDDTTKDGTRGGVETWAGSNHEAADATVGANVRTALDRPWDVVEMRTVEDGMLVCSVADL
jgi:hypothetical protein